MKTKKCISLLLILLFLLNGCSDDDGYSDVDGLPPTIVMGSSNIKTEPGREITIKAKVEDKDGLRSINLKNAAFNLDKTIDLTLDSVVYSFDLNYKYKIVKELEGDNFQLDVTATDRGGRTTTETLLVTMDGDFTNPVFTVSPDAAITVLLKTETRLNVKFTVEDDKALDLVTIDIPEINYSKEITTFTNSGKTLEFNDPITLPSAVATYNLTLKAVDKAGLETSKTSVITVSEMPDFPKMYLADVATVAELNSDVFGVPMRIERTAAYEYKANYYCQKAGTEIFFLPQKSDFTPICFGIDPADNTKLTDDPDIAEPIVLTQANVYYEITFNVKTAIYKVKTYAIADAIDPVPHKFGSISLDTWGDGGSWLQEFYFGYMTSNPREVSRFTQDATNPHLYYLANPLSLEAGEKMNFVFHNWHSDGWWNYCSWRVDNSDEPEIFNYYGDYKNPAWTKPNGADNWAKPTVKQTGSYKLYFDAHLGRAKLVRE
ncbi:hypothetical protein [uncultured Dysgonomonas sp.]|uniref:Cadherin domain-containing protein n=1 Tax=uncultured Dysgonomonas sp. TaxID=206096 RepID=A0A212JC05_9BACT|nr:hypothetical protein [uncultured Dysgonomonas sp.]SBV96987.1 conserved exported hypothetical protein [uncultured Dysgonomonas sp.]